MRRHSKHVKKKGDRLLKSILAGMIAVLFILQLLMLSAAVREKLSIVDALEGQQIELEKK